MHPITFVVQGKLGGLILPVTGTGCKHSGLHGTSPAHPGRVVLAVSPCLQRIHARPCTAFRPLDPVSAGVPDTGSVQEVIFWQGRTIQMMYHIVGEAMRDAGVSNDIQPTDYLQFFCLGGSEDTVHVSAVLSLWDADLSCILLIEMRRGALGALQLNELMGRLTMPMPDAHGLPLALVSLGVMWLGSRSTHLVMCPSMVVFAGGGFRGRACAAQVGSVVETGFSSGDSFDMQNIEARHRSGACCFCLAGNRETLHEGEKKFEHKPQAGTPYENAQKNRCGSAPAGAVSVSDTEAQVRPVACQVLDRQENLVLWLSG